MNPMPEYIGLLLEPARLVRFHSQSGWLFNFKKFESVFRRSGGACREGTVYRSNWDPSGSQIEDEGHPLVVLLRDLLGDDEIWVPPGDERLIIMQRGGVMLEQVLDEQEPPAPGSP